MEAVWNGWVGISLSCKSGADMGMGWEPGAVTVVVQNEKQTAYCLVVALS